MDNNLIHIITIASGILVLLILAYISKLLKKKIEHENKPRSRNEIAQRKNVERPVHA